MGGVEGVCELWATLITKPPPDPDNKLRQPDNFYNICSKERLGAHIRIHEETYLPKAGIYKCKKCQKVLRVSLLYIYHE